MDKLTSSKDTLGNWEVRSTNLTKHIDHVHAQDGGSTLQWARTRIQQIKEGWYGKQDTLYIPIQAFSILAFPIQ